MQTNKLKPLHIILAIAGIMVIVGIYLVARQININLNPIVISKVPADAKVYINGKEVGDRTNLSNGTYEVTAKKEGFSDFKTSVIIDDGYKFISVALSPSSSEAKKWAEQHEEEYLRQEAVGGERLRESGELLASKNPIVTVLPIDNYTSTVGYIINPDDLSGNSIIVTVDALDGYRNAGIASIFYQGIDPGDYTLTFTDYTNPFDSEGAQE